MQRYLERRAYEKLKAWKELENHSTLEISGARQVGKTYIVKKFAKEQYKNSIYINLLEFSGELFLEQYHELRGKIKEGKKCENPVYELIKGYQPDFEDSEQTIVIIDEIQESEEIYNRIREFTRDLKSDFIVTGSYLGRVLNKGFKYSAGDLDSLEIHTLSFEEFLMALGQYDLYHSLDLYGGSDPQVYQKLHGYYDIYCEIGGYPAVVLQYLENNSLEDCRAELLKIIRLFANESRRYFEDILDDAGYENLFFAVARTLAKEKKGLDEDSFSEELQAIVTKDYSSNITKASVNRAIDWLYSSGIIGFAGKVTECNIMKFKAKARCYFMDVGLASYFLTKIGCEKDTVAGVVNENFVYLDLRRRLGHPSEIALEMPAFATYKGGEIDFYVKAIPWGQTYGVEVKAGKSSGNTAAELLKDKKVDRILYAKGNTQGGKTENSYTIPIYGIAKFHF